MTNESFLNTYRNASTAPSPDLPADLASFMLAVDPVLADAAELARVLVRAHQGAATQLIGEGWAHARKFFSLSEKYAAWANYHTPAEGSGIHAYAHTLSTPIRLTDQELRSHPEWRNFGDELDSHPPMRGWLAVPLIGSDALLFARGRHLVQLYQLEEAVCRDTPPGAEVVSCGGRVGLESNGNHCDWTVEVSLT